MGPAKITRCLVSILAALAAANAHPAELKIATLAPDGTTFAKAMRAGGEEIADRTDGRVKLRLYPGGAMGNDTTVLRKIRVGQLHGGAVTGGALSDIFPDVQIYGLPVLFRSYDEVDYVRARVDAKIIDGLADRGFVSFGLVEAGFSYLMSNKPITTVDGLKGQKAWMPEGDAISQAIFEAADISPVPLPLSDVLTGLQTGLVNTVGSSPVGAVALQWFTKVKYLTKTPLLYIYGTVVVSQKAFKRIAPADQEVVREVMGRIAADLNGRSRTDNAEALQALVKQGITVVEPTAEETGHWEIIAADARLRLKKKGAYAPELLEEVLGLLEAYRNQAQKVDTGT